MSVPKQHTHTQSIAKWRMYTSLICGRNFFPSSFFFSFRINISLARNNLLADPRESHYLFAERIYSRFNLKRISLRPQHPAHLTLIPTWNRPMAINFTSHSFHVQFIMCKNGFGWSMLLYIHTTHRYVFADIILAGVQCNVHVYHFDVSTLKMVMAAALVAYLCHVFRNDAFSAGLLRWSYFIVLTAFIYDIKVACVCHHCGPYAIQQYTYTYTYIYWNFNKIYFLVKWRRTD